MRFDDRCGVVIVLRQNDVHQMCSDLTEEILYRVTRFSRDDVREHVVFLGKALMPFRFDSPNVFEIAYREREIRHTLIMSARRTLIANQGEQGLSASAELIHRVIPIVEILEAGQIRDVIDEQDNLRWTNTALERRMFVVASNLTSAPNMYLSSMAPPSVCPPTSLTASVTL